MEIQKKLLDLVDSPSDLRQMDLAQLSQISQELREYIIEHVSQHGGHFAASLGVVELTVALHYVFNTPYDQLVWDVGHQAYGHKILTGRKEKFHTNRKYSGLSGFPKRSESPYDTFGVGHSSTSISAALGMSVSSKMNNLLDKQHVAVIGDGSMTAGLAFEAMNHAGFEKSNMLVILNDNGISIDPNVGALKEYLTDITTSKTYNKIRDEVWKVLGKINKIGNTARVLGSKLEDSLKVLISRPGMLFEALGFRYFGPIDGHDINHLVRILEDLKEIPGPKLLHCVTVKGKGFKPAEENQTKWHASSSPFDKITGKSLVEKISVPSPPKYQDVFGETIIELAKADKNIVAVTPAMPSGSGLVKMFKELPDQVFDVGIAEQHAVTFSAGMATQGTKVFCNIYSTFMQRAYDQVVHDVAIQKLPVVFCLDRAGVVGADGPTHHGVFDLAYMRILPNMVVAAPMNEIELRNLMFTAANYWDGPMTLRYPRGKGVIIDWKQPMETVEIGKGRIIREGEEVAILSIGHHGNFVVQATEKLEKIGINVGHFDLRFLKPLDEEMLHHIFQNYSKIITVEDGSLQGGMGTAILEFMADHDYFKKVVRLGIPDRFIEHGTQQELYEECKYDTNSIYESVLKLMENSFVEK